MNTSKVREVLLVFIFLSISLSFEGLYLLQQIEFKHLIIIISIYICFVIFLQYIILGGFSLISNSLFCLSLGILGAINTYSLKLLLYPKFHALSTIKIILVLIIIIVFFYFFAKLLLSSNKLPKRFLYLFIILTLIIAPVASNIFNSPKNHPNSNNKNPNNIIAEWNDIKFTNTPNIHIISFDSFVPERITKQYLDIQSLPYTEIFSENFLKKSQSISPRVPTKRSLNSLMNLDNKNLKKSNKEFPGQVSSIVSTVLRNNGYELITGSPIYYVAQKKGPFIDQYHLFNNQRIGSSLLCQDKAKTPTVLLQFFSVCKALDSHRKILDLVTLKSYFPKKNLSSEKLQTWRKWPQQITTLIEKISRQNRPHFTFHYIYRPIGHTTLSYDHENDLHREKYKNEFYKMSSYLDTILKEDIKKIQQLDPESIIILFGDHGMYLSRSVKFKDDPDFYLEDRHTVELGIMQTDNQCASKEAFHYSKLYATPSRLLAGVLRCLSDSPKDFDLLVDFSDDQGPCIQNELAMQIQILEHPDKCITLEN